MANFVSEEIQAMINKANKGDVQAQGKLAFAYLNDGQAQDFDKALDLLCQIAQQGDILTVVNNEGIDGIQLIDKLFNACKSDDMSAEQRQKVVEIVLGFAKKTIPTLNIDSRCFIRADTGCQKTLNNNLSGSQNLLKTATK